MEITPADLSSEYVRSMAEWPWLDTLEAQYHLPPRLLVAVGSRETNLTNEVGDGGHGHGVWQLDDRSHIIPAGFDTDVHAQAVMAAAMLRDLLDEFAGITERALAAYNAGSSTVWADIANGVPVDTGTAHGDYATDVIERRTYLLHTYPPAPPAPSLEAELFVMITSPNATDQLLLDGAEVFVLTPARRDALREMGVPLQMRTDAVWAEFQKSAKPLP